MNCRICQKELGDLVFSLGEQPISNSYVEMNQEEEKKYALDMFFCDDCKFIQMEDLVYHKDIFCEDYAYVSSCSSSWLEHCSKYTDYMINRFNLPKDKTVMEVASNDGHLLKFFLGKGYKVKGVEPSKGVADMAIYQGVDTDVEFCGVKYAEKYLETNEQVQIIAANNVIAHNPDVSDFVNGMRILLEDDGIITIEFPHLYNLIKERQFDTIYHEHYSYFSLRSIIHLMSKCWLTVFDVQELKTHGGSLRVFVKHAGNECHVTNEKNINEVLNKEESFGLHDRKTYERFGGDIELIKDETRRFLKSQKEQGHRVVAYGAPAKGNTFLNYCEINSDLIEYTVDRSKYKVGKKLPGSHIPIYEVQKILDDDPDFILILPWNIKDEIKEFLKDSSASLIVAIPELEVL